jgi:ribonuclease-3
MMDRERFISLKEFENLLGYKFNKIELLNQAFTHKSYANESGLAGRASNEVLEFLGDAVLNLAVTHLLIQEFPEAQEGILSLWRANLVKRSSLAILSKKLRLDRYLLLGKSEILNGGMKKSSILANAYEALIGAIYIDSNFDRITEIIWKHIRSFFLNEKSFFILHDYKSLLQKHIQKRKGDFPQYEVLRELGPDHDKLFEVSVSVGGEVKGIGYGKSKKEAQQEAAKSALKNLGYNHPDL